MAFRLRPMRGEDIASVHALSDAAFVDLAARLHRPDEPAPEPPQTYLARYAYMVEAHPGDAWVAEQEGEVVGAALAVRHEELWGLALLTVRPDRQSGGVGRALLERALSSAAQARGGIILSSHDTRAVRLYARAGFALEPAMEASGHPRGVVAPASVRSGTTGDDDLLTKVDRSIRGSARTADLRAELGLGARLLVCEDRGYAVVRDTQLETLAALDVAAARDLLKAAMAGAPAKFALDSLTARQDWAIEEALEAGLELSPTGPVLVRGEVGPLRPYLPSGSWL